MSERLCRVRHRTHTTLAKCIYRYAVWVYGDGPYASLAYCNQLSVELHPTLEGAQAAKQQIDRTGCGHACHRDHRIVYLDLEAHRVRRADIPWEDFRR